MCVVCVVCDGDARAGAFGVAARARRRLMVDGTARSNGERRARARRPREAIANITVADGFACVSCAHSRGVCASCPNAPTCAVPGLLRCSMRRYGALRKENGANSFFLIKSL